MNTIKEMVRWLLTRLYAVEIKGLEHYRQAGERVLIIANHSSYLDPVLLFAFFPDKLTFAVNSRMAQAWWVRLGLAFVNFVAMDPANPLSLKKMVRQLRAGHKAVIFPEGRMTVTGALMKVYQGPGMVAERSGAAMLPVRIDGAQYTPFSHLRGRVRIRWFPKITLNILPPRALAVPASLRGRARRDAAGQMLSDIMTEMMFETTGYRDTLLHALLDARRIHGGAHVVVEDIERRPLTYNQLLTRMFVLGEGVARDTRAGARVGVLLPNAVGTVAIFLALHAQGRIPAMLNYSAGARGLLAALRAADLRVIYTSRQFVAAAKLERAMTRLAQRVRIIYLEDVLAGVTLPQRVRSWVAARFAHTALQHPCRHIQPDDPAVVLFTSGSEGAPKGVVLSHANLLANHAQLASRFAFSAQDVILNVLPMFHSFGLSAATLLPLFSGMKTFLYPTPLHYRIIPEIAYDVNATILFGTNTFLAAYACHAHPYDFYSLRYVFAGAERLHMETRRVWSEKFGLRLFEGYGATETAPVLAVNTPMDYRAGSVGRLLPGVEHHLVAVPGIEEGGRLEVRGPNVMLGYLHAEQPGVLAPATALRGTGWYDTGDIVAIDTDGYVWIKGRAQRYAEVGGEMVSLAQVEALAGRIWPAATHAAVMVPIANTGEQVILLTTEVQAECARLHEQARAEGLAEINVPQRVVSVPELPLSGSGKVDYSAARRCIEASLRERWEATG